MQRGLSLYFLKVYVGLGFGCNLPGNASAFLQLFQAVEGIHQVFAPHHGTMVAQQKAIALVQTLAETIKQLLGAWLAIGHQPHCPQFHF